MNAPNAFVLFVDFGQIPMFAGALQFQGNQRPKSAGWNSAIPSESSIGVGEIAGDQMKSILDPSFRYTASFNTDLRRTFARIRRDRRQEEERAALAAADTLAKVSSIVGRTAMGR
jgi:hypothetical protein